MSNDLNKVVAQTTFTAEVKHKNKSLILILIKIALLKLRQIIQINNTTKTNGVLFHYSLKSFTGTTKTISKGKNRA